MSHMIAAVQSIRALLESSTSQMWTQSNCVGTSYGGPCISVLTSNGTGGQPSQSVTRSLPPKTGPEWENETVGAGERKIEQGKERREITQRKQQNNHQAHQSFEELCVNQWTKSINRHTDNKDCAAAAIHKYISIYKHPIQRSLLYSYSIWISIVEVSLVPYSVRPVNEDKRIQKESISNLLQVTSRVFGRLN